MDNKKKYSNADLKEFESLINEKLEKAKNELEYIKTTLSRRNDSGTDNTMGSMPSPY